ncbi:MAG: Mth938-like domain-containing protein [Gammaproteobacteria bacterium]
MLMSQEENTSKFVIRSYQPGKIQVNEQIFTTSIALLPSETLTAWNPQTVSELTVADFDLFISDQPEVLLIGTGERQHFFPLALLANIIDHQIGFEIMDTAAACRTYNLLAAEGRKVAAGLLIS